jgi:hypothetical protein
MVVVMFFVGIAMNKAHRDQTGVNMPTSKQFNRIQRTARKKGISAEQAYKNWLKRKQRTNT